MAAATCTKARVRLVGPSFGRHKKIQSASTAAPRAKIRRKVSLDI
jgi:hypothetical protein